MIPTIKVEMLSLRAPGRPRKLPQAVARGVLFLLLAVTVVCGTVQAGARYFYCEAFGLSLSDPCAQGAERREQCPLETLDRTRFDCCQIITMPSMPDGARAGDLAVAPAGVVAILPAVEDAVTCRSAQDDRARWSGDRWRRPPRTPAERRAALMVSLT